MEEGHSSLATILATLCSMGAAVLHLGTHILEPKSGSCYPCLSGTSRAVAGWVSSGHVPNKPTDQWQRIRILGQGT